MKLLLATHTDVGVKKPSNEDSAAVLEAQTPAGIMALAVIADGVGGLSNGELASADIVRAFLSWFRNDAVHIICDVASSSGSMATATDVIIKQWDTLIQQRNQRIISYGEKRKVSLGTTLVALLVLPDNHYLVAHVGDSRVYTMSDSDKKALVLTRDHTVAAQKIEGDVVNPDELFGMEGHNVLVQCIGATLRPVPDFIQGTIQPGEVFLLCSDGFSNRLKQEELYEALNSRELTDESTMKQKLAVLTETVKSRGEKDNITAVLVKVVE